MIDLHCHILPGVDDGSADEEESCAMARLAVESGVTDIAATPHCNAPDPFYNYADSALHARFARLRQRLEREQIPLRIHEGMEVFTTPELPRLLDEGRLLTLGGTRYLLIEFAFGESEWFFDEMLAAVRARGLTPVLAHPERYTCVQDEPRLLRRWAREGTVLQANKGSFFGMFGRRAAAAAHWALADGCLHLIASDAHSPYRRTTRMSDIFDFTADFAAEEIADFLLRQNPADILANRSVYTVREKF